MIEFIKKRKQICSVPMLARHAAASSLTDPYPNHIYFKPVHQIYHVHLKLFLAIFSIVCGSRSLDI